ncbi:hypothetical protein SARC_14301 [Sphaeroforma arctica JP610]|uniref:non-specific serine/threonine protein kinase n=1 Tax=Sphaeroforma arctica JP610 TaxID=667725 RepID=A0A0L0F9D5_9EUKA|nr:hypothetical protein SARC_14301 [Sphaeroforma arctica JP610]KNC73141.1 hypothetical protein SARC_14301 [Sphaeroforma arctica JP610]|eukprot:XP_014147043.1 hypothetical protein SARC_14301 [Sphaeroforma arctica JP610]
MINPFVTKMSTNMDSEGEIKQTDIIAAADATGDIKSSKRRRASSAGLASLRFNSSGDVELGDLVDRESSENTANTSNSKRNTLQSSHGTHGVEATEPRRVGNVYSVPIATSEFTPQDLMAEVQRVLTVLNIYFVTTDTYLIACTYDTSAEKVVIEIEIVKVWLVNKLGVQLKRKSGSLWLYKEIYSKIISAMQIPN